VWIEPVIAQLMMTLSAMDAPRQSWSSANGRL